MADNQDDASEIKDTDIVFDCPCCGKSLAIDYRGAGLTIPCTDCGNMVEVPIPEGMEISDIDSSDEDQELEVINLRRLMSSLEEKNLLLDDEVSELRDRREVLEHEHSQDIARIARIRDVFAVLKEDLSKVVNAVGKLTDELAED